MSSPDAGSGWRGMLREPICRSLLCYTSVCPGKSGGMRVFDAHRLIRHAEACWALFLAHAVTCCPSAHAAVVCGAVGICLAVGACGLRVAGPGDSRCGLRVAWPGDGCACRLSRSVEHWRGIDAVGIDSLLRGLLLRCRGWMDCRGVCWRSGMDGRDAVLSAGIIIVCGRVGVRFVGVVMILGVRSWHGGGVVRGRPWPHGLRRAISRA